MAPLFVILVVASYVVVEKQHFDIRKLLMLFYSVAALGILTLLYVIAENQTSVSTLQSSNNLNDLTQVVIGACYLIDFGLSISIAKQFTNHKTMLTNLQRVLSILGFILVLGVLAFLIVITILFVRDYQF